ncbi:IS3 family transposase [Salmonella enterica]|uniref:IS3 family transposase n=5 Tax=Salmonella enterica TaxID=28901 RepID=A0A3V2RCR7_SALET|nr:IS3 family transposase [Salmonella enterica subsp. enterica serovar Heidelberg]EAA3462724.1 IS3 family transposase [Salmonella enterica subsp. enterica serovar Miami]EAA4490796.1 IS3 family transposase [Salmonella enterica subsp. enterica]EAM9797998.1 IS3 family transposase [Salmonella enterica]EBM1014993.1 IS3 family transposase [Salmonella enterica subsp. enterica serovar Paratyphi B]EBQ5852199.1 IS3 family transposase [Salmonella enterica subsp. enterica serovar Virchow]ECA3525003.1 IS3
MHLLPPYNWSLRQVADDIGAGISTVHGWRQQLEMEGLIAQKQDQTDGRSPEQIFSILLETAIMSEHELAEYCRKNGLYAEQIRLWKQNCLAANMPQHSQLAEVQKATRGEKTRIRQLEKEFHRKDKALAEIAALLVLQEKPVSPSGRRRGRLTPYPERLETVSLIETAVLSGARQHRACEVAGITVRTLQRWRCGGVEGHDRRPDAIRPEPANRLSDEERQRIVEVCTRPEYVDRPPCHIVPALADRGIYIASESSFYRVLKAEKLVRHRGRAKAHGTYTRPTSYTAAASNRLWSWDITHLPSQVKGRRFYLYMITDVFSRKVVGAEVHERESGQHASELLQRSVWREKCDSRQLVLHADNGSPMKSFTMQAKLYDLGIVTSHSRPRVSNDNPYSESLFRTLKYCPQWPRNGFHSVGDARIWVHDFVQWYNTQHRHSGIRYVTPEEKHSGKDIELLARRKKLYETARKMHPERWSQQTRNWSPVETVSLNPEKERQAA